MTNFLLIYVETNSAEKTSLQNGLGVLILVGPLNFPVNGVHLKMVKPFFRSFFKKWLSALKRNKMKLSRTKQAGSECTLSKPLYCPNYGESLILIKAILPNLFMKIWQA